MGELTSFTVGDCRTVMAGMEPDSVDAIVTDPPYGIGFMGREWDTFAPANVAAQRAAYRRKTAFRTDAKGGFVQGGGVPISYDESLTGNQRFQGWCEDWATEALRVLKPGGHLVVCSGTRTSHRMTCGVEDAGFDVRDVFGNLALVGWVHGSGFPKSRNLHEDWEGWGTALKPSWEPILLARKPFPGTVASNVATHGVGALHIDACRIEGPGGTHRTGEATQNSRYTANGGTNFAAKPGPRGGDPGGRWPANVILDEAAAAELDGAVGTLTSGGTPPRRRSDKFRNTYGAFTGQEMPEGIGRSSGGPSRFFYTAKTSRSERDAGLSGQPEKELNWSSGEQSPGTFQSANTDRSVANHHPTVKPIALMRWLVRLVTPIGGLVLDPFAGSGSTGCAAVVEGMRFVGIELNAEYAEIARRRIAHWQGPIFGQAVTP